MLRAFIDGLAVDRAAVAAWEDRRTAIVRRKLGLAPSRAPRDVQRRELLERKLAFGHDGLRALLSRGLWWSGHLSRVAVSLSQGRRRFSVCRLDVSEGSAEHFARWFEDRTNLDDERSLLDGCPDHYIIAKDDSGRQVVVETTGGSPAPGEFTIDYSDLTGLQTEADAAYPFQVAGAARLSDELVIGGVRHQFRQEGAGFRAWLTVEFPYLTPVHMIAQHRWHLATEFSNWIEAAEKNAT